MFGPICLHALSEALLFFMALRATKKLITWQVPLPMKPSWPIHSGAIEDTPVISLFHLPRRFFINLVCPYPELRQALIAEMRASCVHHGDNHAPKTISTTVWHKVRGFKVDLEEDLHNNDFFQGMQW